MTMDDLKTIVTAVTALLGAIYAIFQYFKYQSRREKIALVRQSFDAVVKSLASTVEVERMSGAILLRRFYDPETEVGIAGTPYWQEALNVSAAILRGQTTGNFQKVLADGLAFAKSLAHADLQRTNLQFAYLGKRDVPTNLEHADFYRADLSGASLKRANAREAVFYQARLHRTVFTRADLREANFFEADLRGARFDGALLDGATFASARNVPAGILAKLDGHGVYRGWETCKSAAAADTEQLRVFVSKPGLLDDAQQECVRTLLSRFEAEGIRAISLERGDYPRSGALSEVQRLMADCSGAVIFGFRQLEVRDGMWRPGTSEQKHVQSRYLPTPWNQIEAGMATMLGLPLLIISQRDVDGGIFDLEIGESQSFRLFADDDQHTPGYTRAFADWCADVRERGRTS